MDSNPVGKSKIGITASRKKPRKVLLGRLKTGFSQDVISTNMSPVKWLCNLLLLLLYNDYILYLFNEFIANKIRQWMHFPVFIVMHGPGTGLRVLSPYTKRLRYLEKTIISI